MSYTLTKYEKETVLLYNQSRDPVIISTYDPGLRRRLREYAALFARAGIDLGGESNTIAEVVAADHAVRHHAALDVEVVAHYCLGSMARGGDCGRCAASASANHEGVAFGNDGRCVVKAHASGGIYEICRQPAVVFAHAERTRT